MSKQDLENSIRSLETTFKIVRVTELSTLGKLGYLRRKAEQAVAYYQHILESLNYVRKTLYLQPEVTDGTKLSVLVITSDRGFCGAYNRDIFAQIDLFIENLAPEQSAEFFVIGQQGYDYLKRKEQNINDYLSTNLADITVEKADEIAGSFIQKIYAKETHELHVIFTQYISAVEYQAQTRKIYPDIPLEDESDVLPDYILDYEEADDDIERLLLSNYLGGLLYSIFLYSVASEYCSRRISMRQATDNVEKRLQSLIRMKKKQDLQNKTNELLDILAGAKVIRTGEDEL